MKLYAQSMITLESDKLDKVSSSNLRTYLGLQLQKWADDTKKKTQSLAETSTSTEHSKSGK